MFLFKLNKIEQISFNLNINISFSNKIIDKEIELLKKEFYSTFELNVEHV